MQRARITDVAEQAGVSVSTVSNVLQGRTNRMRATTYTKVQAVIQALEYRPSQIARHLRTGGTPMLGLLVPWIANAFASALASEVEAEARKHGFYLLIGSTRSDPSEERRFLEEFRAQGVRGVILASSLQREKDYLPLIEDGLALTSLSRRMPTEPESLPLDMVSVDNVAAGRLAATALISEGHKSILYVTPQLSTLDRIDRRDGFVTAMAEAGLRETGRILESTVDSSASDLAFARVGRKFADEIAKMSPRPTAVVAANGVIALGLIGGLQERGLMIPGDISVIGIDDVSLGDMVRPSLTTVSEPLKEIARELVTSLVQRQRSPLSPPKDRLLSPSLVRRSSIVALPARAKTRRHASR